MKKNATHVLRVLWSQYTGFYDHLIIITRLIKDHITMFERFSIPEKG